MNRGNYHVLAKSISDPVIISYNPNRYFPSGNIDERIKKTVTEKKRETEEKGGTFYNDPMVGCFLDKIGTDENGNLTLETQRINYFDHVYYRKDPKSIIQALYISFLPITKDNDIFFGSRNPKATEPTFGGKTTIVGGGVDIPDLDVTLRKEVFEELGLIPYLYKDNTIPVCLIGASKTKDGFNALNMVYVSQINLGSEEMDERFREYKKVLEEQKKRPEFDELYFLPNNFKLVGELVEEVNKNNCEFSGKYFGLPKKDFILSGVVADILNEFLLYRCDIEIIKKEREKGTQIYPYQF